MDFIDPTRLIGTWGLLTNITPFTYRDGLTYLEAIERLRKSMIETIDYANGFGKDAQDVIDTINATTDKFVTDVKGFIATYDKYVDDRKTEVEADITAMNALIADFKARLISAEFQFSGTTVSAPLMGGGKIDLMSLAGITALEASLRTLITTEAQARTDALTAESKARTDAASAEAVRVNAALDARPTLAAADVRYAAHSLDSAVFIGSSNATLDAAHWTKDMADHFGWRHWNYAIGGGGFTSSASASFLAQTNNAINDISDSDRRGAGYFFICDMLNDIRAGNSVTEQSTTVFRAARTAFPNARIIVLPVVLNQSSLNNSVQTASSASSREAEVTFTGLPYDVEVIPGSMTWLYNDRNESNATDKPGEVHLTDFGYMNIRMWVQRYIYGGDTWRNMPWTGLYNFNNNDVAHRDYNYLNVSRHEKNVTIRGTFQVYHNAFNDAVICNVPGFARPYEGVKFPIHGNNRTTKWLYINNVGQVACGEPLDDNETYNVNFTYRIW